MAEETAHQIEEHIHLVNFITLRRIYDVLLGIYSNINAAEADTLANLHDAGLFASPEPSYVVGEDGED